MQVINSNVLSSFANGKAQFSFRPEQHRADKAESPRHEQDHKRAEHGGKRAIHVFRQEIFQTLRLQFQNSVRMQADATESYRQIESPTDVVSEILAAATGITQNSSAAPSDTVSQIRESVKEATNVGQEMAASDEDSQALKETEEQIVSGLDTLEKQATASLRSFTLDASIKQRSMIQIRTQEGDVVKFELRQVDRLSATDMAIEGQSGSTSFTEIAVSSRSRFVLKVDGDLNEAELAAITNVFAQAEKLADEFFAGDMNAALEIATAMEFDPEQLARVSMKFRSQQSISAAQTILQGEPLALSKSKDSAANEGRPITNANPVTDNNVAPEARPVEEIAKDSPVATNLAAGFGSLINYLKSLADYLENQVALYTNPTQRDVPQMKIRFEFKESLRLEILRTVMTKIAPSKSESEPSAHGDTIKQLAETLEAHQ